MLSDCISQPALHIDQECHTELGTTDRYYAKVSAKENLRITNLGSSNSLERSNSSCHKGGLFVMSSI